MDNTLAICGGGVHCSAGGERERERQREKERRESVNLSWGRIKACRNRSTITTKPHFMIVPC